MPKAPVGCAMEIYAWEFVNAIPWWLLAIAAPVLAVIVVVCSRNVQRLERRRVHLIIDLRWKSILTLDAMGSVSLVLFLLTTAMAILKFLVVELLVQNVMEHLFEVLLALAFLAGVSLLAVLTGTIGDARTLAKAHKGDRDNVQDHWWLGPSEKAHREWLRHIGGF